MSRAKQTDPLIIYNLFPRLAGSIRDWKKHLDRIVDMGFTWVFINPIHYSGFSGSLYSIKDYYAYHLSVSPEGEDAETALRDFIGQAHSRGLRVMVDYVINHTAIDSILVDRHPDWYQRDKYGNIKNPCVMEGDKVTAVWGDLAEIDNLNSPDRDNLWQYWIQLAEHYIQLGFDGFRCDAAYQVPAELWEHIISDIKAKKTDAMFFAETLGCELDDTKRLIEAGFDVIFNSSKWWNFDVTETWCLKQNNATASFVPSISFPESHDTVRLAQEEHDDWNWIKTRYLFSSIFSEGVMAPIGFEYGFHKKLDVVQTNPSDWEEVCYDLSDYIRQCHDLKKKYPIFQEDAQITPCESSNENVTVLLKQSNHSNDQAIILINRDRHNYQEFHAPDIAALMNNVAGVEDVSPDHRMESVPDQFHYNLMPGQIKVLYGTQKPVTAAKG